MKRTFNYTGRKRVPAGNAVFMLKKDETGARTFDASIDLNDLKLSESARVYVEAYYGRSLARFDFGAVQAISPPPDRSLEGVEFADRIAFRVKVVDESGVNGRILALVDGIDAELADEESGGKRSILPVSYSDSLASEVWRVVFTSTGPVLEVNNLIPGIRDIVRADRVFSSLVRPQAMRSVLHRLLVTEEMSLSDASMDTWQGRWILFAQAFCALPLEADADDDDRSEWVDAAVAAFAKHIDARGAYVSASGEEE